MSRRGGKNRGRTSSQTSNRTDDTSSEEDDSEEENSNSRGNKKYSQPVVIFRTSLHNTIFDVFRSLKLFHLLLFISNGTYTHKYGFVLE